MNDKVDKDDREEMNPWALLFIECSGAKLPAEELGMTRNAYRMAWIYYFEMVMAVVRDVLLASHAIRKIVLPITQR